MGRRLERITEFNAGELSPYLYGRTDLDFYSGGSRLMRNVVPLAQGPIVRLPGTMFQGEAKFADKTARMVPFLFNIEQAYPNEFGEDYIRIWRDRGQVTAVAGGGAVTNGTFDTDIAGWTDISSGSSTITWSSSGFLCLNHGTGIAGTTQQLTTTATGQLHALRFRVISVAGDKLDVRIGTTSGGNEIAERTVATGHHVIEFTPPSSPFWITFQHANGGTRWIDDVALIDGPVELGSPYDADDLEALQWTQSADVMYLSAARRFNVRTLKRFGHASWSLELYDFIDGPYLPENTGPITLTPAATSGRDIDLTASADFFDNTNGPASAGQLVRLKHGSTWGWAIIRAVTSATVAKIDIRGTFGGTTATSAWRLGLYNDPAGQPTTTTFFEERLGFAGAGERPDRVDASKTALFDDFTPGTAEGDPLSFVIGSKQVNPIRWLDVTNTLLIGTAGAIHRVGTPSREKPIQPLDSPQKPILEVPCAAFAPVRVGARVLFLRSFDDNGNGRKLIEPRFDVASNDFIAFDLTRRAEHITVGGLKNPAYQGEPWQIVWAPRADGKLLGLTYVPEENVIGWHLHDRAGGLVESVATIPGQNGDELWMVIKRTINGATKRYIERMVDFPEHTTPAVDRIYTDATLTYDGAATTSITGLGHLEGETVQILADGAVHKDLVVSGGAITLDVAASKVHVGLGSVAEVEPLMAGNGTTLANHRINELGIRFVDTVGAEYGRPGQPLEQIPFRQVSDAMDTAVPLFSGPKTVDFPGTWEEEAKLVIRQSLPLPLGVSALNVDLERNAA